MTQVPDVSAFRDPPDREPDAFAGLALNDRLKQDWAAEEAEHDRTNGNSQSGRRSGDWVREPPESGPTPKDQVEHATTWAEVDLGPVVSGLLAGTLNAPEPTICRLSDGACLFYSGRVNSVFGDSTAGKTWLALVASRQEIEAGRHVFFFDFEDHYILTVGRLLSIGTDPKAVVERFHYISPDEPFGLFAKERVEALLARHQPSWTVIDSTGESMALDNIRTNQDEDVSRWNRNLPRWIARRGPGVGLLDHVPKDPTNRAGPSGSHRKKDMVTGSSFYMEPVKEFGRNQLGIARLTTAKDRCGFYVRNRPAATLTIDARLERHATALEQPYACSLEPPAPIAIEATGGRRPTWLMEAASTVMEATPGLTKNAVITSVGKNKPHTSLAIELLIAEGYAETKAGPNRSQFHHSLRPYRQATDPKLAPQEEAR